MPAYIEQLQDKNSEAAQHLNAIKAQVRKLEKNDPDFLARNHDVDIDYFDLIALPVRSSLQGSRK